MPHEMYSNRGYFHKSPAWHKLGHVNDRKMAAWETLDLIGGEVPITIEPIVCPNYPGLVLPERVLVRHPIAEDPGYQSFGVVGPEYSIVTTRDIVQIWDEHVALPVETMGYLRGGRAFFVTCELPEWDVKGDEMKWYMMMLNWNDSLHASTSTVSGVRTVCMNTARLAQSLATESYKFTHDSTIKNRMAEWMSGIVGRALKKQDVIKEACDILAAKSAEADGVLSTLEHAYPLPKEPGREAPEEVVKERLERYEAACSRVSDYRDNALALFVGKGTGMDSEACRGTYWGLYQAVVENEDYRRGGTEQSTATNTLIGNRAAVKERAFEKTLELCRN